MSFRASSSQKTTLLEGLTRFPAKQYGGNVIKAAVLYGANAAGKSNFLKALQALGSMVVSSDQLKLDKPIPAHDPFLLDAACRLQPTTYEIEFVAKDQKRYVYEVCVEKRSVLREELFVYPSDRKTMRKALLFSRRAGAALEFGEFYRGKRDFALNDNQLLLSQAGLSALPALEGPYRFFATFLINVPADSWRFEEQMLAIAERAVPEGEADMQFSNAITSIIKAADTGISRIFAQGMGEVKLPADMTAQERERIFYRFRRRIKTVHPVFEDGKEVGEEIFDLSQESTGTVKLLGLATFIVDALQYGSVVVVDELDKNLHPLLTRMLVRLFSDPSLNAKNAQLVFSTHDISLMDKGLFRLDQMYIVDKDVEGASSMSRLSDFTGITKVEALQKWYMHGLFKGVPAINDYEIDLQPDTVLP